MKTQIFNDREKWLKNRASYIGGSDLATILCLNPYCTPFQLWQSRTGKVKTFTGNKHTLAGRFMEDGVAKYWEFETENNLIKRSSDITVLRHPEYSFLGGSPDRRFFPKGSNKLSDRAVLEVKTTSSKIDYEDIPYGWFLQPNFYTGLLGYKSFVIVWFEFFTKEIKWQEFEFDKEMFDVCVEAAKTFWNDYIVKDTPPPATNGVDIELIYPKSIRDKSIIADNNLLDIYSKAIEIKRKQKVLKEDYTNYADKIKLSMRDSEYLLAPDLTPLFTYKTGSRGRKLLIKEI